VVPLVVVAIGLYVVWPSLRDVWAAAPTLREANPWWFAAMALAQAASFVSMWRLQRIALDTTNTFLVATTQLASNAASKVVPAGGAAGAAVQHRMLVRGGVDPIRSITGVTVVAILTNASVFVMPVVTLPVLLGGTPVHESLVTAAWLGVGLAAGLIVAAVVLVGSDGVVRTVGRGTQWVLNRVRRRRETGLPDRLAKERALFLEFLGPRWPRVIAWTTGKIGFDYLSLLAALAAVGARPRATLVVLAYVAAMVLATIPITPGGLGFVEAGLTATLTVSGVPGAAATTATLAYRLVSYWLPLLAGGIAYVWFARGSARGGNAAGAGLQ
jgi:uncharacterized protein (TIRG00374 family)